MGNFEDEIIDENELRPYLREGIQMRDLVNLKKAFLSLDTNQDGLIEYDINKLGDINKFDLPVQEPNGKSIINFKQFMNLMIDNITRNRKKFGNEATSYESETSTVLCFICPFKQQISYFIFKFCKIDLNIHILAFN